MKNTLPLPLLGGRTANEFMREYWQKKPLLIRQAVPNFTLPLSINDVRELATDDHSETRLILREGTQWQLEYGPFDDLPSNEENNWTLLLQNAEAYSDAMAALLHQFRFIGDARLDDAMISIATDGGGVGPHFDSYDVFLLQAHGQRRWRISSQDDLELEPDLPLKILKNFQPEHDYILEPGDMLYLPPHIAHDGVAIGNCMTISIGFRAPSMATLARGMLDLAGDHLLARNGDFSGLYADQPLPGPLLSSRYRDPDAPASEHPARLPQALTSAALEAARTICFDEAMAERYLGHWLTEPSPAAYFKASDQLDLDSGMPATGRLVLDRCTRLMYTDKEVFINGELAAIPASDAVRQLADTRFLACTVSLAQALDEDEYDTLAAWLDDGWLHYQP